MGSQLMGRAAIVEAIAAASPDAMRRQRDASRADLVELRLDLMDRPDADAALAGRTRPVIATCRAAWEGGRFQGSEADRLAILTRALALGADYVDLEWKAAAALADWPAEARARVVLSNHDFDGVPADLADRVRDMRGYGTGVVKIAVTARTLRDALPVIAIGRAGRDGAQRTVAIAMGTPGIATRVLPDHIGSCWTYGGNGVAPGQVTVDRLRDEFRVGQVGASTPVYAVVGRPIGHSVSPAMHNAAFAATGIDGVYLPCEAADFEDFLALADVLGIAGASVTAPYKEDAARTAGQGGARSTPCAARDGAWQGTQYRRRGLPRAAGRGPARRAARGDRRRRRIGALGRQRPGVARGARVGARAASRGGPGAGRRGAGQRRCVAGAAGQLGSRSSTPRRWARIPTWIDRRSMPRIDRPGSTAGWSTTSSTTRGRRGCCATPQPPAAAPSMVSTCSSRRPSGSSSGGPA